MSQNAISGFTIVRNATELGYPFLESVRSALPLCDEFLINCGDSSDNTEELCQQLVDDSAGKVRFFRSTWSREGQSGGFQLKAQTDAALARCSSPWCLYIQADEVLHEADFQSVLASQSRAQAREDVDGVLFHYLHFYGDYSHQIVGRNWYRREVRLFKNFRGIQAFRDAQGFRRHNEKKLRVIQSDARVFHYGYVRTPRSLDIKSKHMALWWGTPPADSSTASEIKRHVGLRAFTASHPRTMDKRIQTSGELVDPTKQRRYWDANEIKNAVTLLWESVVPYRIGEFTNYEIV